MLFARFDSPSVFAKILDSKKGVFEILTESNFDITQSYLEDSCILKTKFKNNKEEFEVIDFMRFQDEDIIMLHRNYSFD